MTVFPKSRLFPQPARRISSICRPRGAEILFFRGQNRKGKWFKRYRQNDRPESFERIVQSWDTANKATELSDFSVCTTWGIKSKTFIY